VELQEEEHLEQVVVGELSYRVKSSLLTFSMISLERLAACLSLICYDLHELREWPEDPKFYNGSVIKGLIIFSCALSVRYSTLIDE
jgi:hypothetical protein